MKPISYQSMPSSVNGGPPNVSLGHPFITSKVIYCEKCRFATMDPVVLKKHMAEHMETRFHCFYCNNISYSELELNEHVKQHTSKYPFECPHCGQGYMRRLCLVKHIDRLHSKNVNQGPAKPGMVKSPLVPVSSALTSALTADPSPPRPVARVTIPTPIAPAVRAGKDEQRGKTLDTNSSFATNGSTERVSNLNGLIQPNRALTVSLPEEVSIPAGCLVELVEVKTVNGTKELKLRLISQQENESVIKDTQTTTFQNTPLVKPPSSTHPAYPVRSMSMGMCTVNRKQTDTKTVNIERSSASSAVPAKIPNSLSNVVNKEKNALKRASPEIIDVECNSVPPNKVSKNILSPVREGNVGIRVTQAAPVNHSAAPSGVISSRVGSRLNTSLHPHSMGANVPQRVVNERKNPASDNTRSTLLRRLSDSNNIQDVSSAVKLEPGQICPKSTTAAKEGKDVVCLNRQSTPTSGTTRSLVTTVAPVRPPATLVNKGNVANQPFSILRRTLIKPLATPPVLSNHTNSKPSTCARQVRANGPAKERGVSEPESFPVISSVFSLSEQPEEGQGSMQPLVMALRGIVMDKTHSHGSSTQDHLKVKIKNNLEEPHKTPESGHSTQVFARNGFLNSDVLPTGLKDESVKVEEHDVLQAPALTQNNIHVKEEKQSFSSSKTAEAENDSRLPASIPSTCEEPEPTSQSETPATVDRRPQADQNKQDLPSKFLTISLKRVQVGVWKKSRKGLKVRVSRYKPRVPVGSLNDYIVIYPMPLKEDQLVKRPGPNQPVVVLNHPKPRASIQKMREDSFADMESSEAVPKCQILKMRLSKVMGQKYEVMGCTVRVFP
uniref:Zinc finger protein 518B n=1 Tax=Nothobranchius kuhntae TaxID=321403 RepID=A0A1A8HSY1_NOTKU